MTASAVVVDEQFPDTPAPTGPGTLPAIDTISAATYVTDDGRIVAGDEGQLLGAARPENVVRGYVNRVGDAVGIVTGGHSVRAEGVMAAAVSALIERTALRYGTPPLQVCVTHPAHWGAYKIALLDGALQQVGIKGALLVADVTAAAAAHAPGDLRDAGTVAVFALGGDTASAAVVASDEGSFRVLGNPPQPVQIGGADFDQALFEHVCRGIDLRSLDRSTPGLGAAVSRLRSRCTAAKEALSVDTDAMVSVELPGFPTRVRVVRSEFEDLIRDAVQDSIDPLLEAIEGAGHHSADIDAVLLIGGSSRIPLVVQTVSAELRRPIVVDHCPEATIARGAAMLAAAHARTLVRQQDEHQQHETVSVPDEPSPQRPGELAAADAGAPAHRIVRNRRRRAWADRPGGGTAVRASTRHQRIKQAVATALLATAVFATSSAAAPHILDSGGVQDVGALAGSTTQVDRGSSSAKQSEPTKEGPPFNTAGQH